MLLIGKDRKGRSHYVLDSAITKSCGYKVGLCSKEVAPEGESDGSPVECSYCNHAYDLGEHHTRERVAAKKPTQTP